MIKLNFQFFFSLTLIILIVFFVVGCSTASNSIDNMNDTETSNSNEINEQLPIELNESEIEMLFMGDVMMDSFIADYINDYGVDYPWADVAPILIDADISVVNLETSVSDRGSTKKPEGYGFRSAPETLQGLKNSGIDLVSLANNHVMDFGNDAFYDTLNYLNDYSIKYIGAGKNIFEAEKLVTIEKNGLKVGFLSFSSIIPREEWLATEEMPGVASFKPQDYDKILDTIKLVDETVDILTVVLHWGTEYQSTPNTWQIEIAHKMVDNGADLIIGHHPHVLQGIEIYKDKPILYSIGNFVFLKKDDEAGKTGIFRLVYDKNGFKEGSIYPVNIKYTKANLLQKEDQMNEEIINKLANLSKVFGTEIDSSGIFN